jgi:ketosteroid isomerase-like protein
MPKLSLKRRDALAMLGAAPLAAPALAAPDDVAALLQRKTQALLDAITNGDAAVWQRLLADEAVVTDESGIVNDKATVVKSIAPLPARISGNIAVQDFAAHVRGDVAVVTYVSDEHESFFGAKLHCQYRSTDSWRRDAGEWRLVASQVLAIRTDPPAVPLDPGQAAALDGTYALAPDRKMVIAFKDGALTVQEGTRPAKPLLAEAPSVFFIPGSPRYRYLAQPGAIIQRREAWDLRWVRET